MKKSSLKSLTFVLALSMVMTILALPSCRSLDPTIVTSATSITSATSTASATTLDSVTILRHDSVIYRERTVHDTVYITKEVFRNQRLSTLDIQHSTIADTVHIVEYRDRVIEHPPERFIPPFYKHCTVILWIILAAGIVWIVGKWYIKWKI